MNIQVQLSIDDVNSLLNILGELPTKTAVYPLAMSIRAQAEEQLKLPTSPSPEKKFKNSLDSKKDIFNQQAVDLTKQIDNL